MIDNTALHVWRSGDMLVMARDAQLPMRCVKTNAECTRRIRVRFLEQASPLSWGLVFLLVSRKAVVELAFSAKVWNHHRRHARVGLVITLIALSVSPVLFLSTFVCRPWADVLWESPILVLGLPSVSIILAYVGIRMILKSKTFGLKAERITQTHIWLSGAGRGYLATLPQWPGSRDGQEQVPSVPETPDGSIRDQDAGECPRCKVRYAFDGIRCRHCGWPAIASENASTTESRNDPGQMAKPSSPSPLVVDCPHCGAVGVMPTDDDRCPNCKGILGGGPSLAEYSPRWRQPVGIEGSTTSDDIESCMSRAVLQAHGRSTASAIGAFFMALPYMVVGLCVGLAGAAIIMVGLVYGFHVFFLQADNPMTTGIEYADLSQEETVVLFVSMGLIALLWTGIGYFPGKNGKHDVLYCVLSGFLPGFWILIGWRAFLQGAAILRGVDRDYPGFALGVSRLEGD